MLAIQIVQIISAVLLVVFILAQERGSGLGALSGSANQVFTSRRGVEKVVFNVTVLLIITFVVSSILMYVL